MTENKYKKLGKNSLFVLVGNVGGRMIALLMMPFYTRVLTQSEYGTVELIQNYSVALLDIVTFCICSAIFIFPKTASEQERKIYFSTGLFCSVPLACVLLFLFFYLGKMTLSEENCYVANFNLIAVLSIAWFLQTYFQNFIRSIDKMKVFCLIGVFYTGFTAVYSFIFIPILGVSGFIYALAGANITTTIYSVLSAKLYKNITINIKFSYYWEMLKYSFPLIGTIIVSFLNAHLCKPLLEHYHGLDVVGQYSVANKFSSIVYTLIPVFCLAWQASVIEEFGKPDYIRFFNKTFEVLFVAFIAICFILIPLYPLMLRIFASQEYAPVWIFMPFIVFDKPIEFYSQFTQANFLAAHKSNYILYCSLGASACSVLLNMLLVKPLGIWGVVIAINFSCFLSAMMRWYFSRRYVTIQKPRKYVKWLFVYLLVSITAIVYNNILATVLLVLGSVTILVLKNHILLTQLYLKFKR